jgi:hypothetical protein
LELSNELILSGEIKPWFSLKINGVEHEIYNHSVINKLDDMHITTKTEKDGFVTEGRNIKEYVSNSENVTEIKWDPFDDNISIPYKNFYKFIKERLEII